MKTMAQRVLRLALALLFLSSTPAVGQSEQQPHPIPPMTTTVALRSFHTIYLSFKTSLIKPAVLAGRLQGHREFDLWQLSITNDPAADVIIEVDHQPGWFYYYYTMTHRESGLVLASGKTTDLDGASACRKIADTLISRIKRVRAVPEETEKDAKK